MVLCGGAAGLPLLTIYIYIYIYVYVYVYRANIGVQKKLWEPEFCGVF